MGGGGGTGRRLTSLVLLVIAAAMVCLVWALPRLGPVPLPYPLVMALLVAVAGCGTVFMRVRSQHLLSTVAPAVLATVLVLPGPWAVACTGAGFAVAKAVRRQPVHKAAFNTAKEVIAATAAVAAAGLVGLAPVATTPTMPDLSGWAGYGLALLAATAGYVLVDELVPPPVIGLATGVPAWQVLVRDWRLRWASRTADLPLAGVAVALIMVDLRLVAVMPPLVLAMHLTHAHRLRLAEERRSWQRLASATDALAAEAAGGDLTRVLHTAVTHAGALFPATVAEVQVHGRTVRGDGHGGVAFDGPTDQAPPAAGPATAVALPTGEREPAGELRLRFPTPGAGALVERERFQLATLAGSLATAVSNTASAAALAELAERNAHDATHDPLTGLPNRRQLGEHLQTRIANSGPGRTGLLLLDLDHFKEINDSIGHSAGDTVLTQVAARLQVAAGEDALVARLGGDEFAIVFPVPAPAAAVHRAERIIASVRQPMTVGHLPIGIDASGGLTFTTTGVDDAELLRQADVAMYRAKGDDRPVRLAVYTPRHDTANATALVLRAEIPRVLAAGDWQLTFHPIVDLGSGHVAAVATSIRWPNPDHHVLATGRLLGMLERAGLLPEFTHATISRAAAAAARWRAAGFDLPITITLTPRSLAHPGFPDTVAAILADHDLPPSRLLLTLAHTTALDHTPPADQHLATLRSSGVRIGVNGIAGSTLATLHRLPVDQITIEPELVADLATTTTATALVRSVTELARRLDATVTADGVETRQQREILWENGCSLGHGRMFGTVTSAEALTRLLATGFDNTPGMACPPLHSGGTVIPLSTRRLSTHA